MSEAAAQARTDTVPAQPAASPLRAAAWMVLALFSFSAMAVSGRELSGHLNTFNIMFYRSIVGLMIVCVILAATGSFAQIRTQRFGFHVARNVAHFTGQNLWFFAVGYITLAQLFALEFTSPVWVALLAPLFLGERFTPWRIGTTLTGFIGILLVVRPGVTAVGWGEIAALSAAVFFAINIMTTKSLSRTESTLCIVFWMTLLQALMAFALTFGQPAIPSTAMVPWLIVVGISGLTAHFSLARAFRYADASVVAPMDFLRLPLIAVVGALAYSETLDPWVFIGGAVVFLSNYANVWRASHQTS